MLSGLRTMRVYIKPQVRVVRLEPSALLAASQDDERVEFVFHTHTPSIWEDDVDRVIE